jgi:hypothetical protein
MARKSKSLNIALSALLAIGFAASGVPDFTPEGSKYALASSDCQSSTPSLVNGSFESFPNPDVVSLSSPVNGGWHGYAGGPNQILFLNQNQPDQVVPGWKTTAGDQLIEIQRQVSGFEQDGTFRSGSYFDTHNAQPAHGNFFAELNANNLAAFYQDIEAIVGQTYYWSVRHRGRQFASSQTDTMLVKIGPPGSLAVQSGVKRYRPTNNPFTGSPVYGEPDSQSVSIFRTALEDGWVRYQGSFTPSVSETIRFQFEASSGGSVGNFLDDVQFTVFKACAAEVAVAAGTETQLDVTSTAISLGDDQELQSARVLGDIPGTVIVDGDNIRFETDYNGDVDVEYVIGMDFGGTTLTQTGLITFRVTGGVAPPPVVQAATPRIEPNGPKILSLPGKNLFPNTVLKLTGTKLDKITDLSIGGFPSDFKVFSAEEAEVRIPSVLKPGSYNLVALTAHLGKFTFIEAIQIRPPLKSISVTTVGKSIVGELGTKFHVRVAQGRDKMLNKARCIVNSSSLAKSTSEAEKLCARLKATNPELLVTVIEPRASSDGSKVTARVVWGWVKAEAGPAVWLNR